MTNESLKERKVLLEEVIQRIDKLVAMYTEDMRELNERGVNTEQDHFIKASIDVATKKMFTIKRELNAQLGACNMAITISSMTPEERYNMVLKMQEDIKLAKNINPMEDLSIKPKGEC